MGQFSPAASSGSNTAGSFSIVPMPESSQIASNTNYLSFDSGNAGSTFAQQYLPELYEAEVERYGNRTLSGFLRMVGAEMPMSSDQVIWSEQNRLHIAYDTVTVTDADTLTVSTTDDHVAIRVSDTIVVSDSAGKTVKAFVTAVSAISSGTPNTFTVDVETYGWYDLLNQSSASAADGLDAGTGKALFVYGSEFDKGTSGRTKALQPQFTQFNNSPIIIKDYYEVNGSDATQIGWVEVTTEEGANGYFWYLKAESETRLRFQDYLEMAMVEGELKGNGGAKKGTQGMFAAIEERGNVYLDYGSTGTGSLADFDNILKNLDKQGSIEENMLFLDRETNLAFDDMLAELSKGVNGGTAYGLFDNDADMALNLGFSGFRRGSYDFYKTDWKYLNDPTARGLIDDIDGALIPAGTSTVYDQILGQNIRRPFLHVRYRAAEADDRRMKSWVLGSVGGAYTSSKDAMEVHFLSERCLCVQGANNFMLFKNSGS
tara:strand:- start:1159 stop:2619 length:1461 start_codon:yes stop_codon:yes gene_type:complete